MPPADEAKNVGGAGREEGGGGILSLSPKRREQLLLLRILLFRILPSVTYTSLVHLLFYILSPVSSSADHHRRRLMRDGGSTTTSTDTGATAAATDAVAAAVAAAGAGAPPPAGGAGGAGPAIVVKKGRGGGEAGEVRQGSTATYLELKAALVVAAARSAISAHNEISVSRAQALSVGDPGVPQVEDDEDEVEVGGGDGTKEKKKKGKGKGKRDGVWAIKTVADPTGTAGSGAGEGGGDTDIVDRLMDVVNGLVTRGNTLGPNGELLFSRSTKTEAENAASELKLPQVRRPELVPVEAEWQAHRSTGKQQNEKELLEADKFRLMMKERNRNGDSGSGRTKTVLYFHGGGFYLNDPASMRGFAMALTKRFGGGGSKNKNGARMYMVRYRLAPQHPFPAAILDALVSYMYLLYPPPGEPHAEEEGAGGGVRGVRAEDVVFSGDSAGGNLALSLARVILELRRIQQKPVAATIRWFGVDREVPLPAGICTISPWIDMTQSMPSLKTNAAWDFMPPPAMLSAAEQSPPCAIWPDPERPRRHLIVDDAFLLHPLISLQDALGSGGGGGDEGKEEEEEGKETGWMGCPPVYINCGWEALADEIRYFTGSQLMRDGVTVVFEQYEAMPHVFPHTLPFTRQAKMALKAMAEFVEGVTRGGKEEHGEEHGEGEGEGEIESVFKTVRAPSLDEVELDPDMMTPFSEAEARDMALRAVRLPAQKAVAKL